MMNQFNELETKYSNDYSEKLFVYYERLASEFHSDDDQEWSDKFKSLYKESTSHLISRRYVNGNLDDNTCSCIYQVGVLVDRCPIQLSPELKFIELPSQLYAQHEFELEADNEQLRQ